MTISDITTGLQHIGIPVNNMEETVKFYTSIGFTIALETVNEAAGEKVTFLQNKNLMIEAYENGKAAMEIGAIEHICLDVTDIDKAFQIISEGSFEMLDTHVNFLPFWENGVKFFTILGPNKEKIEFAQKL